MQTPHDGFFKAAFGRVDVARGELALVLPTELVRELDLASLEVCPGSFVDETLRHAHSDLLYTVRARSGRDALVYVLAEHQSSFDATMPLRLLRYVVRIWERWLVDHPTATTVPIVVPLVMHHGPGGWRAAPELASMLDADEALLGATRAFVPHFRFLLDDLSRMTLDELAARAIPAYGRLAQLALWSARSRERLLRVVPVLHDIATTEERSERTRTMLIQLYEYLLRAAEPDVDVREMQAILMQIAGPEGYEDVMNAAEQLIAQGLEKGLEKGLAQGAGALRAVVATAFEARGLVLSELGRARVASCTDLSTLQAWVTRAITATSEADVFA
jgi:predicted transposase/invertase (TIGR01784 family)